MNKLPSVRLNLSTADFDLLLTILSDNADNAPDESITSAAQDLIKKRMQYTRLHENKDGERTASVWMYETEAAEMIWQLMYAAADRFFAVKEFSAELK